MWTVFETQMLLMITTNLFVGLMWTHFLLSIEVTILSMDSSRDECIEYEPDNMHSIFVGYSWLTVRVRALIPAGRFLPLGDRPSPHGLVGQSQLACMSARAFRYFPGPEEPPSRQTSSGPCLPLADSFIPASHISNWKPQNLSRGVRLCEDFPNRDGARAGAGPSGGLQAPSFWWPNQHQHYKDGLEFARRWAVSFQLQRHSQRCQVEAADSKALGPRFSVLEVLTMRLTYKQAIELWPTCDSLN